MQNKSNYLLLWFCIYIFFFSFVSHDEGAKIGLNSQKVILLAMVPGHLSQIKPIEDMASVLATMNLKNLLRIGEKFLSKPYFG